MFKSIVINLTGLIMRSFRKLKMNLSYVPLRSRSLADEADIRMQEIVFEHRPDLQEEYIRTGFMPKLEISLEWDQILLKYEAQKLNKLLW